MPTKKYELKHDCKLLKKLCDNCSEICSLTLNKCNNSPETCDRLKPDDWGLLHRCDKLENINGELLCEGASKCANIDPMQNGNYYDCMYYEMSG